MKWMELREEEFEEAVQRSGGLCVVPVGCFEMHGQHLPVGTDVYEAVAVAEKAAEMEDVVIFPAFEFGDVARPLEQVLRCLPLPQGGGRRPPRHRRPCSRKNGLWHARSKERCLHPPLPHEGRQR